MLFATKILFPFTLGLGYFLLGMYVMRTGFAQLAGDKMAAVLTRFTKTPTHGFFTGMFTTFVLQSSSAVTVLTIGLTNAGIISFAQTVGIILGTNVGTTVTTQLIALKMENLAVPLILIGAALWLQRKHIWRQIGLVIAGFGLIFLGIDTVQVIAKPLQGSETFRHLFLESSNSVWLGLLTGTLFTALIHSGSATTAIVMSLMQFQIMTMDTALAVVLGANIGTCFTALVASIGTNAASKQVAWCHTLFNMIGALLFLPFLSSLASLTAFLSDQPATQIAHAQTIFNVICSLTALPFAQNIATIIQWMFPDKRNKR